MTSDCQALINYMQSAQQLTQQGCVYLIGAGPGDIELITLKALRILGEADVVLVDALVNEAVLQFVSTGAEIIEVGKRCGKKSSHQGDINALMIEKAQQGLCVVRLKGGDPMVFARGGEEMLALFQAGIEVTVVSGLTAGLAIPAALKIPLTHREIAQSLVFAVGSSKHGGAQPDWQSIVRSSSTIVIYMGLARVRELTATLIAHGLPGSTPAAAVHNGTLPDQLSVICNLEDLPLQIEEQGLSSPTLLVVGKVVALSPYWCAQRELIKTGGQL
jgi:uroporphyrin-III C-methyltransferase